MILAVGVWGWTPDRPRDHLELKYWDAATRYMEIGGTSLRVRITGPTEAPAVIFLHGFGSSLETWEAWAQALSAHHRVMRFDLPGCGLSEPDRTGRYDDTRSLQLVTALMDALNIEKAALVGNSMGAGLHGAMPPHFRSAPASSFSSRPTASQVLALNITKLRRYHRFWN